VLALRQLDPAGIDDPVLHDAGQRDPRRSCRFSNSMSSSRFERHRDVIDDTKVRISKQQEEGG
jgi:hypothetical protein